MAADPYKYFRVEARELLEGLTQGTLELEKGTADRAMVASLLRLAHTLKGAARVVKQPAMAELAHGVEDILSPFRDRAEAVPCDVAPPVLHLLDQIGSGLAALDRPAPTPEQQSLRPASEEPLDFVRVNVEELESVLGSLSEASILLRKIGNEAESVSRSRQLAGQLVQQLEPAGSAADSARLRKVRPLAEDLAAALEGLERSLGPGIDELEAEISVTRECANRLCLLPSSSIFPYLERAVRDAAITLGKPAGLETAGGEIRLDAQVLLTVRNAVLHLVRNAVAHGLETAAGRAAAGKPPRGRIQFRIERRGNRVAFLCRDDGGGIDVAAIRRAVVKKGAAPEGAAETLGLREAIDLIFHGGVTTTPMPTVISGRGIGLDVVRELTARLKGEIAVETAAGSGTTVEICVPVSLTSVPALLVECNGLQASIPLDSVREARRIAAADIAAGAGGDSIAYEGQTIPFVPLARVLERPGGAAPKSWLALIVAVGTKQVAIGVDHLAGSETVIVHSVPPIAATARVVAGASLDAEGNPQLALDPASLVEAACEVQARRELKASAPAAPEVLVIDDSLTTRMVEQSILESAGYSVDLARSGEEAVEKALAGAYRLFLVDVEMPGMDGFEFVAKARADPALRNTPAVLVTSRNSEEDRARGVQVGARAYIVKSEFDQAQFLQTIHRLVRC